MNQKQIEQLARKLLANFTCMTLASARREAIKLIQYQRGSRK